MNPEVQGLSWEEVVVDHSLELSFGASGISEKLVCENEFDYGSRVIKATFEVERLFEHGVYSTIL
jgi:hypothetical protein